METTLGGILLAAYLLGIPLLWKVIARKGHPGLLRNAFQIETAMLAHIALLLAAVVLLLMGLGDF